MTLEFPWRNAAKPSMTLTWKELILEYDLTDNSLKEKVSKALWAANAVHKKKKELELRVAQAESVRDWARNILVDKAKGVCRYTQRMAALRAELTAEIEAQADTLGPKLRLELAESVWNGEKGAFQERAIDAGLKAAKEAAVKYGEGAGRMRFPGVKAVAITAEDVKDEEE